MVKLAGCFSEGLGCRSRSVDPSSVDCPSLARTGSIALGCRLYLTIPVVATLLSILLTTFAAPAPTQLR